MRSILIIFFTLIFSSSFGQNNITKSKHYADRRTEGYGQNVELDEATGLPELVNRLKQNWHFVETGKAYWIGYTDDMFSIANYGDQAIRSLTDLIDTTGNLLAKIGALYTLHLIGINSKVAGRFIEDFQNKNARNALLRYLNDRELNKTVVSLIMRDPWISDIPNLLGYLRLADSDYSPVLSALKRYKIDNSPMQELGRDPEFLKSISFSTPGRIDGNRDMYHLIVIEREIGENISIDTEITNSQEWIKSKNEMSLVSVSGTEILTPYFFFNGQVFSFCNFSFPFYYTYSSASHKLNVYGEKKTRQIWLEWWKNLSEDKKNNIICAQHTPFDQRNK